MVTHFKKIKREGSLQTVFYSILIGAFLVLVIGFLIFSNLRISSKRSGLTNQIEDLRKEIQIMEQKNANLKAGIIQTEDETYWEEKMRNQGYKKPGEEAVIVLPPEEQDQGVIESERGFFEKFLNKIGL